MQTRMELHIRSLATAPHTSMQTEAVKRGSRSQEDRESQTRCSLGFQVSVLARVQTEVATQRASVASKQQQPLNIYSATLVLPNLYAIEACVALTLT